MSERILIIEDDLEQAEFLLTKVTLPLGCLAQVASSSQATRIAAQKQRPDLVLFDLSQTGAQRAEMKKHLRVVCDLFPVILLLPCGAETEALEAFRMGVRDVLFKPLRVDETQPVITRVLHQERMAKERDALLRKLAGSNEFLEQSLADVQTLYHLGRNISSSLDTQDVLRAVVNAAIKITGADEGYLILVDPDSDRLFLRAWQDLDDAQATCCHIPVEDHIAQQVLRTGEPVILSSASGATLKIGCKQTVPKSKPFARSLVNVPLRNHKHMMGVLGVDNVSSDQQLDSSDVMRLSALADTAAIAIKNAELYTFADQTLSGMLGEVSSTRYQTDLILQMISEGIYTVDSNLHIVSVNPAMERITGWQKGELLGRSYLEVFAPQENGCALSSDQTVPGKALHTRSLVTQTTSTILHKDGRRISVTGTAAPILAADAPDTYVLATIRKSNEGQQAPREVPQAHPSRDLKLDRLTLDTLQALHVEEATEFEHRHPITLRPIITQVVKGFDGNLSETAFQVELASDLAFALGNESEIELALVNLIENVLQMGDPQEPIRICASASEDAIVVLVEGSTGAKVRNTCAQPSGLLQLLDGKEAANDQLLSWWAALQVKYHIAKKLIEAQGGKLWADVCSDTTLRFQVSLQRFEVNDATEAFVD